MVWLLKHYVIVCCGSKTEGSFWTSWLGAGCGNGFGHSYSTGREKNGQDISHTLLTNVLRGKF